MEFGFYSKKKIRVFWSWNVAGVSHHALPGRVGGEDSSTETKADKAKKDKKEKDGKGDTVMKRPSKRSKKSKDDEEDDDEEAPDPSHQPLGHDDDDEFDGDAGEAEGSEQEIPQDLRAPSVKKNLRHVPVPPRRNHQGKLTWHRTRVEPFFAGKKYAFSKQNRPMGSIQPTGQW